MNYAFFLYQQNGKKDANAITTDENKAKAEKSNYKTKTIFGQRKLVATNFFKFKEGI